MSLAVVFFEQFDYNCECRRKPNRSTGLPIRSSVASARHRRRLPLPRNFLVYFVRRAGAHLAHLALLALSRPSETATPSSSSPPYLLALPWPMLPPSSILPPPVSHSPKWLIGFAIHGRMFCLATGAHHDFRLPAVPPRQQYPCI